MMKSKFAYLLSGIGFSLLGLFANADELPSVWSYQDCVDYAHEQNISLRQARLKKLSSSYDLEAAKAQWFPTLNFSTSQGFTNYPRPADNQKSNTYTGTYNFNANWTIYNGKKRENTIKKEKINEDYYDLNTEQLENNLKTQILIQYLQILYSKEAIQVAKEAADVSKYQMERAEELMNTGRLSKVDYTQLKSQYSQDLYTVTNAESTYETYKLELKNLLQLGIANDMNLQTVEFTEEEVMQALPNKIDVYNKAVTWLPELKKYQLSVDMSDLDIEIAKAQGRPTLTANASVGTQNGTGTGYSFGDQLLNGLNEHIGVTFSVPIIDQKTTKTAVAKAKVNKLTSELDVLDQLKTIGDDIEGYYISANRMQAEYQSGKAKLESTQLTDELTNEKFKIGKVNTLELMQAHRDYYDARISLLQSKYMAILNIKMLKYYLNEGITL